MRLFVVRHGKAARRATSDESRELLDEGITQSRRLGKRLIALEERPDMVFCSPYVRARQTAEHVMDAMSLSKEQIVFSDNLLPGGDPEAFLAELVACAEKTVFCFTHAPFCDLLVARILGAPMPLTSMKTAGVACLDCSHDTYAHNTLVWLTRPSILFGK